MSYNRLDRPGQGQQDDYYNMNQHPGRTPSPGHPLQHGYQLEDANPYGRGSPAPSRHNIEIPMGPGRQTPSDRLQAQPTYSVENIDNSYGHNEEFEQRYPLDPNHNYRQDYALNPQQHHDAYYQPPYQPSQDDGHPLTNYPTNPDQYFDDNDDHQPILQAHDTAYGPDPHSAPAYDNYDGPPIPPVATPQPTTLKRYKTVKEVQLFNGNLVLDCPIPPKLLNQVPHAQPPERDEFTHMRYTAATCDPSEFFEERFTLRQRLFAKPRHTELFIVVTMYNEDDVLFARTLSGVFKNIEYMCSRKESKTWGKDAWKKIVVCVVSDGRAKINPRTRAVLAGMGVYQDGIAKQQVNGKDVTAHIYEYTTQVSISAKKDMVELRPKQQPVQMLFCLKEKNQKKINSHRWFFQAFGRVLDPNICVLLDAGTKPGKDSIYQLWKAFDLEPMCGGACGEIKAMLGRNCLSPDTVVRTTQGPKAIRDIAVGDLLFDHQDNPVYCLAAEAVQNSPSMKKVTYTEYNSLKKTSFICTPDHIMTLLAYGIKPGLTDKGFGVFWYTRCDRSENKKDTKALNWDTVIHGLYTEVSQLKGCIPNDAEVRQYLSNIIPDSEPKSFGQENVENIQSPHLIKLLDKLRSMGMNLDDCDSSMIRLILEGHLNEYLENRMPEQEEIPDAEDNCIDLDAPCKRNIGSITLASSSRSADKTYCATPDLISSSPSKGSQNVEDSQSQGSSYVSVVVPDDYMAMFAEVRNKLDNPTPSSLCKSHPNCKGLRRTQVRFKTREQAELALELLLGDDFRVVDRCAVQETEVFTMTMQEYLSSCTPFEEQKPKKLRLYRAPLVFEPYYGDVTAVPIDPYWLGSWLGDGNSHQTAIFSTDPELKVYLQSLVNRLNSEKAAGAADLQVAEEHTKRPGDTHMIRGEVITATKECYKWTINSTSPKGNDWTPIHQGLKDLGLLGDKSGGIPDCYMNADENTRLAVLAGLVDSDGWLEAPTQCYGFARTNYEHKKIVEDAHKLATSCGIQCTPIKERQKAENTEPSWRFYMSKGSEKFQRHILLPRKRLNMFDPGLNNRDIRPFDVEDIGPGEYRLIEVSGELFQLADRTVVHNCKNLLNPLVATQNFEYKMSNILDKPLESAFGFISVLPGAFSAYRYVALQNDKAGDGPLEKYFAGEKMHGANAGIFTANMYLAEDRILCFELVSKRNCHWILQYVKSATGETDVPDQMAEFILQRRRWLNGSFFAAVYSLVHFYQVFRSDHSFLRKIMLLVEFIYTTISMLFAWFAIGNFYLVFHILTTSLSSDTLLGNIGKILSVVFEWLYLFTLLTCFILALGNRPQGSNKAYMSMVIFWVFIMAYLMFASVFITVKSIQAELKDGAFSVVDIFKNQIFYTLIVSLASTYLLWFVVSFLFFDPWHMFTSFVQYLLLTPTYINILNVYAFCNTHDITWGTKGDDKAEKLPSANLKPGGKVDVNIPTDDGDLNDQYEKELRSFSMKAPEEKREMSASEVQEDYYKGFRSQVVLFWLMCNFGLVAVVLSTAGLDRIDTSTTSEKKSAIYLAVVLWSVAGLSAFKFTGAMWFLIVRMFRGV